MTAKRYCCALKACAPEHVSPLAPLATPLRTSLLIIISYTSTVPVQISYSFILISVNKKVLPRHNLPLSTPKFPTDYVPASKYQILHKWEKSFASRPPNKVLQEQSQAMFVYK